MQSCYWAMEKMPGLSTEEQAQLKACGITTTRELLEKAKTNQGKQTLANQLKLNIKYVNKWVALADLARIPSVGCDYSGLLLHAGVASVSQLIQLPIHRLHRQVLRFQVATMQRQDLCPPVNLIQQWIQQGKSLD